MSYLDDLSQIWQDVKASFQSQYSQSIIDLWFGDLKVSSFENNQITLVTESEFKYKIVKEKYLNLIKEGFSNFLGFEVDVELIFTGIPSNPEKIKQQFRPEFSSNSISDSPPQQTQKSFGVLPQNYSFQYTFDNFIVGNSNKFAHAACTAVAARPAMDYNPLFIYGPSGLGKTHLMNAVVNEIKRKNPNVNVVYTKGDDFTNQLIECMANHEKNKFHEKFRNCDILLIDDIQFIAGNEATQEEFFHTFNTLYEEQKQIVISSDRPPRDIQPLEERLKTRFEWGLIADIQPPDLELRIAIIKKKAEQVSVEIPNDVLTFLAENLRSNIRQIEGAIKKLSALSFLSGRAISMELARSCISDLLGGAEPVNVTVDKIFTAVFNKYNVKKEELTGSKRNKDIAQARHVAIYLIRTITEMSYPNIGKIFGGRDYSTIIASYNLMNRKIGSDPLFNLEIEELMKEITSS